MRVRHVRKRDLGGYREEAAGTARLVQARRSPSPDQDLVVLLCRAYGLPEPELEVCFHPSRRWRADYLWRAALVILEQEGGVYRKGGGAHSSIAGILRDIEKGNAAQLLGYVYLRATPTQIRTGAILPALQELLLTGPRKACPERCYVCGA